MNKSMQITPPEGYEVDIENSTFENIVFKEKVKSTRWEDLRGVSGWYVNALSQCCQASDYTITSENVNIYATKEQCIAHLAQAKLSQIMKKVNDGWGPDWTNDCQSKAVIALSSDKWRVDYTYTSNTFLTFTSKEIARQVLRENKDLLEQYKPLAG